MLHVPAAASVHTPPRWFPRWHIGCKFLKNETRKKWKQFRQPIELYVYRRKGQTYWQVAHAAYPWTTRWIPWSGPRAGPTTPTRTWRPLWSRLVHHRCTNARSGPKHGFCVFRFLWPALKKKKKGRRTRKKSERERDRERERGRNRKKWKRNKKRDIFFQHDKKQRP